MVSDPKRIWREAEGQVKRRVVEGVLEKHWPELVAALNGQPAGDSETPAQQQPLCRNCGQASGRLAICRAGDIPVCGMCAGLAEFRSMRIVRVSQWSSGHRR